MRVGARNRKRGPAGRDKVQDGGARTRAQCHRAVRRLHEGGNRRGRLHDQGKGTGPEGAGELARTRIDPHAKDIQGGGPINKPSHGLGEVTMLEGEDATIAGDGGGHGRSGGIGAGKGGHRDAHAVDRLGGKEGERACAQFVSSALDGERTRRGSAAVDTVDGSHGRLPPLAHAPDGILVPSGVLSHARVSATGAERIKPVSGGQLPLRGQERDSFEENGLLTDGGRG